MAVLLGIGLAVIVSLSCLWLVCLREYRISLRWPALLGIGMLIGAVMIFAIKPAVLADIGPLQAVYSYPELSFVLLVIAAAVLGLLLRPWRHGFYRELEQAERALESKNLKKIH